MANPKLSPLRLYPTYLSCAPIMLNVFVLNACYSEIQANAIVQHIDYVIGMSQAIGDTAAIKFAMGFYDAFRRWQVY
jgi:hypothetical protein